MTAELVASLSRPIALDPAHDGVGPAVEAALGGGIELSVTVGEALVLPGAPLDLDDLDALEAEAVAVVQRAELALADARRRGVPCSRAGSGVIARYLRQRRLVAELLPALAAGQVVPYYQPQVDLRSGRVTGVEALVRWEHPDLGVLSPFEVLPVAEQLGVLDELDDVVLHRALRDLARWRAGGQALAHLVVAVNASAASLRRRDVVDRVVAALTAAGLPGSALELEITESDSLAGREGLDATLEELQELGVAVAIDDFGSGYASMDYLVRFSADTIKVDRSLVQQLGSPTGDRMLTAVVSLAHDLGARVLAEGVEEPAGLEAVRSLGFDLAQGYALSRPAPAAALLGALARLPRASLRA